jgi:hypothetical protein
LAGASACGDDAPGDDDGGNGADASIDGNGGQAGIDLAFQAVPAPPTTLEGDGEVRVTEIRFDLFDVRVIGDAAPGDERTWRAHAELTFKDGQNPPPVVYEDAPPGMYSQLKWTVGDGANGVSVRGTVRVDGVDDPVPFELEDEDPHPMERPLSVTLPAGGKVVLTLRVDTAVLLNGIDIGALPFEDGKFKLEDDDPQMDVFRANLAAALSVYSPS